VFGTTKKKKKRRRKRPLQQENGTRGDGEGFWREGNDKIQRKKGVVTSRKHGIRGRNTQKIPAAENGVRKSNIILFGTKNQEGLRRYNEGEHEFRVSGKGVRMFCQGEGDSWGVWGNKIGPGGGKKISLSDKGLKNT